MMRVLFQLVYALAVFLLLLMRSGFGLNSSIVGAGAGTEATRCIERERQALLAFKQGVIDDSGRLSGWGSEDDKKDCCTWEGVECSNTTRHVISLDLYSYGLKGPIPSQFGNLTSLEFLNLNYNNLQGLLPEALGDMTSLEFLNLGYNELEGGIPKSFGNLCRLKDLYLYGNHLNGMLHQIISNLSSGCLLSSLESLDLFDNQITGWLPGLISNFSSLKSLSLYDNKISGTLPKGIGLMSNLEELHIHSNNFSGVITEAHFLKLSKLNELSLSSNHLSTNFSPDWSPPFQLYTMNLGSCMLGPEFPKWIKTQQSLSYLNISHNGISDRIPKWFWNQSYGGHVLDISFNNFSRTLPVDLSVQDLHGFSGIDMRSNSLKGPLPLFPANFSSINLSNNSFFGSIFSLCETVGRFLEFLDLSNNQLSGELPSCFNRWPILSILNLANNQFFGKIPNSIGSMSWLASFSLRNNSFVGEIPWSLGNCSSLQFVDLSWNRLSGIMPHWIGEKLPRLTFLLLKSNTFHGGIPLQLCRLTNILLLDFSNNSLSGSIPGCIHNMTALTKKETSVWDHLYASTPYSVDSVYANYYADTASLIWKGTGYEIQNIKNLTVIDFSSNKLTGPVPMKMWNLIGLVQLNLSRNQLSGSIPPNMEQMQRLESLDLSRNKLSGQLPQSMSQLDSLGKLDLSYNFFSGRIPSGAHIDTFFPDSIVGGNPALCGPSLTRPCPGDEIPNNKSGDHGDKDRQKDKDSFWTGFKPSLGIGAAVGFVGVLALKLDQPWKHLVFLLFNKLKVWLKNFKDFLHFIIAFLAFMVKENAAKLRRKFTFQVPPSTSS